MKVLGGKALSVKVLGGKALSEAALRHRDSIELPALQMMPC
ncbi:hypothetical protein [Schaalia sp. Marseille-Q2122]|nr:hypothetical protein [Schaalia sp. Marseille-Q2122]